MANRFRRKLSFGKRALLVAATILIIAGPILVGLMNPERGRAQSQTARAPASVLGAAPVNAANPAARPSLGPPGGPGAADPVLAQAALGQAAPKFEFEVASVKTSGLTQRGLVAGGPGTDDPTRITAYSVTLSRLIYIAYDVPFDQISGPAWLQQEYYYVTAKVPAGATKEHVKLMWRSLLAERFGLVLHREPKEFPVYDLTVAKGGAKLKPTAYPDAKPARPGDYPTPRVLDADGYPVMPAGISGTQSNALNGVYRMAFQSTPISGIILQIEVSLGSLTGPNTWAPGRVVDKTGLTGKYDFRLEVAEGMGIGTALRPQQSLIASAGPDGMLDIQDPGGGPDLFRALERQLGLSLTKRKAVFDVLIVDHAERAPTEN